jgi:hypothetical protein
LGDEVYLQRNCSAQECDSDDLEGDLNLSDVEDNGRQFIKEQKKQQRLVFGKAKA